MEKCVRTLHTLHKEVQSWQIPLITFTSFNNASWYQLIPNLCCLCSFWRKGNIGRSSITTSSKNREVWRNCRELYSCFPFCSGQKWYIGSVAPNHLDWDNKQTYCHSYWIQLYFRSLWRYLPLCKAQFAETFTNHVHRIMYTETKFHTLGEFVQQQFCDGICQFEYGWLHSCITKHTTSVCWFKSFRSVHQRYAC